MKEVVGNLAITDAVIKDEKGTEFEMAGSIECKGIRGTDRRKYLLDLIRLTPRDANYKEDKFQIRLVRRELMVLFQRTKSLEYATEKMKGEPLEAPTSLTSPPEEATEEEKKKYEEERNAEIRAFKEIQIKKAEQYINEAESYKYNVNVYTSSNMVPSANIEKEINDVESLGKFLTDVQIPKLVKDL
jgi:protein TIF31